MQIHTVRGKDQTNLHVREYGDKEAPAIFFIHGWSQHHLCWSKQIESPLCERFRLVALDLRGHGQSDAPTEQESYTTGAIWADDLRIIIKQLAITNPILVGWSYGGFVISDYLRVYGDEDIAGINFVGAAVGIGPEWFESHIGPTFLKHAPSACSDDQETALMAIRSFLNESVATPISARDMELAMGWNMLVQPWVRANLIAREEDFTQELARIAKPVLVSYGDKDSVVLPKMAETIAKQVRHAQVSIYEGVGHAPFIEDPDRFNSELGSFVDATLNR